MRLLWPGLLPLLALGPLVVLAYVLILRRRRKYAVRYSSLTSIREALPDLELRIDLPAIRGLARATEAPAAYLQTSGDPAAPAGHERIPNGGHSRIDPGQRREPRVCGVTIT